MQLTVTVDGKKVKKEFYERILLWDALAEMGFVLPRPCGGKGVCGKCKVTANGKAVRACTAFLEEDTEVKDLPLTEAAQILTTREGIALAEDALIKEGYGLVVDVGTTTIAGDLYKFPEGELVKSLGVLNPQIRYGADVVTRMECALKGGSAQLQKDVLTAIEQLTAGMVIDKYVITGNTVMLHFLTGRDTGSMAWAPYEPDSLFGEWYGDMYLPRCVSAFVGADVTCAVLASGMQENRISLLVDIGTNGEMVLCKDGRLLCCSVPAGPAFEGAEISMGMLAEKGAIDKVYLEHNVVKYTTIGGGIPKGICGSGLIGAMAVMLECGAMDETGYMEKDFEIGDSHVFISTEDIRNVQLAKAALRAGMETLLQEGECTWDDIEVLYIAGGFGSYVDAGNASAIGLFPQRLLSKVKVLGNAAGAGAGMILKSRSCLKKSMDIAEKAVVLPLADSAFFAEKYVEEMMFAGE